MWCVIKDYDGDVSYSSIFDDYSYAYSYAEHWRSRLNFHWRVLLVAVSFSAPVEIVNKVINGKRVAISQKKNSDALGFC